MKSISPRTLENPVAIAHGLLPLISEDAVKAEELGEMTSKAFTAIKEAGLFQFMFPKRAGGSGHPFITHTETVAELAKADPATAWAFGLLSSVSASVAAMPAAISEKVFVRGDELLCSVAAPTGTATPVKEGYLVTGRWGYASGCMHADYALNGIRVLDESGKSVDQGFAIIPLKNNPSTHIENTWHVAGVAASGSNTVVAEGLIIPPEFIVSPVAMKAAVSKLEPQALLAMQATMEPRDRWPQEPLFPLVVLAPMLGGAQALLDQVVAEMEGRPIIGWKFPSKTESGVFVQMLGRAAMQIDSAWMHIRRAVSDLDTTVQQRELSGFEKARIQADCGHAMGLLREATSSLMDVAGPGAFTTASGLQRLWRDISVGSRHTYLNCQLSEELYGRALTGGDSSLNNIQSLER